MPPSLTIQRVIDELVALAPLHLAANWDNCGLQVGDPSQPLSGVAIAVDPTLEAIEETIARGANLLVTHHPLLFKPPKSLDLRREPGRSLQRLITHGVALYAAHTNLDATAVNVALAEAIGLAGHQILEVNGTYPDYKLGVFVPVSELPRVRQAAWDAGAGRSAHYDHAAYMLQARGTFRPLPGAAPAEGAIAQQSEAEETRLEFLVSARDLEGVRRAIVAAHPYEEPALDVVALHGRGTPYGWGLVGDLPEAVSLRELAVRVKAKLDLAAVRIVGPADRPIRRVAWLGGSGGDYFKEALAARADAYITGEVRHHAALDALAAGLSFIEVGHVGSEQPVVPFLARFFRERFGAELPIHAIAQRDPFEVV